MRKAELICLKRLQITEEEQGGEKVLATAADLYKGPWTHTLMMRRGFSDDTTRSTTTSLSFSQRMLVTGTICTDSGRIILPFVVNVVAYLSIQRMSHFTVHKFAQRGGAWKTF